MIITCEKCKTDYLLDDSRVTGNSVKVKCVKCHHIFIVPALPRIEELEVHEILGTSAETPEETPSPAGAEKAGEEEPEEEEAMETGRGMFFEPVEKKDAAAPEGGLGETPEEPAEEPHEEVVGKNDEELQTPGVVRESTYESSPLKDIDINEFITRELDTRFSEEKEDLEKEVSEEETALVKEEPPPEKTVEKGPGAGESAGEAPRIKEEKDSVDFEVDRFPDEGAPPAGPSAENVIPFSAPTQRPGSAQPPSGPADAAPWETGKTEGFSEPLPYPFYDAEKEDLQPAEEDLREKIYVSGEKKTGLTGLALGIIVFIIIGAAVILFTGAAERLRSIVVATRTQQIVEVESVNGFYADNKNFGKLFVIEARIRNMTNEPQVIKGVRGVIFDTSGRRLDSIIVSPGRVVSTEEIKNLSREEILKIFQDASSGTLPPRATVPAMVLFTDMPNGVSEYGIDVIR